jgi:hypothetical protein
MAAAYRREEMERRVCEAVEAGYSLAQLAVRPGWPSRQTLHRWTLDSAAFAARLKAARDWRRGLRTHAGPVFDQARSQAFLIAVRQGYPVRWLVRQADQPHRDLLNRWKRERPDFAAALKDAVRFSVEERPRVWARYDEAAADAIILRVAKGSPLPRVLADPRLPGATAVRRWRRQRPDFDHALRTAHLVAHRERMARRSKLTEGLADRILVRLTQGVSLWQLSLEPDMPHWVTIHTWMRRDPDFAAMVAFGRYEGGIARPPPRRPRLQWE